MDTKKKTSETTLITVCIKCGQKLRLPIAYKVLDVRCPKCKHEFPYSYVGEFGNGIAHYTKPQTVIKLAMLVYLVLLVFSCISFVVVQAGIHFQGGGFLLLLVWTVTGFWTLIFVLPRFFDYLEFTKYLQTKLLVINHQGIIYFDRNLKAQECLYWTDITSAKFIYARHLFAGVVETKREPTCIELVVRGKDEVRVPPAIAFTNEERLSIISDILRHYNVPGPLWLLMNK